MPPSEFGPIGPAIERVLVPDNPTRVFYRTRRKSGLTSKLKRGISIMKKSTQLRLASIGAGAVAVVGKASADVPAAVTSAITTTTTDVATIGGAVLVVAITIATFIWLRKPMH